MKRITLALIATCLPVVLSAQEVLIIGNSYTRGTRSRLAEFFAHAPEGYQYTFAEFITGGENLYGHSNDDELITTLRDTRFDHIVIQEHSRHHSNARTVLEDNLSLTDTQNFHERFSESYASLESPNEDRIESATYWGAKLIIEAINAGVNANAQIHVFQTWNRDVSAVDDLFWLSGSDEDIVQRHLEHNIFMARDAAFFDPTIKVARVGEAWERSKTVDPSIELYWDDGHHGREAGYFLAAAIIYQQITGLRAIDNPYEDTTHADHLKEIALNFYEQGNQEPPRSLEITGFHRNSDDDQVTLSWVGPPSTEYNVEASTDLIDWSEVSGTRTTTSANNVTSDAVFSSDGSRKYFRVRQVSGLVE